MEREIDGVFESTIMVFFKAFFIKKYNKMIVFLHQHILKQQSQAEARIYKSRCPHI
jgi:hypothetical protein